MKAGSLRSKRKYRPYHDQGVVLLISDPIRRRVDPNNTFNKLSKTSMNSPSESLGRIRPMLPVLDLGN